MDCVIKIPEHLDILINARLAPSFGSVFYVCIYNAKHSVLSSVPLGWVVNHDSDDFSVVLEKAWWGGSPTYPTYVVGKLVKTEYKEYEFYKESFGGQWVTKHKYLPTFFVSNGNQL